MNNRRSLLVALGLGALIAAMSTLITAQVNIINEIAPTGKLRVGMNGANPTLVTRTADGSVSGISVDLGRFIAEKLGLAFEPVVYATAAAYTESFGKGEWDIIVTGRNAFAAKMLDFSADVILIDFVFVAAPGREFANAGQVDQPGIKIGVGRNNSGDVFLSRTLKSAELVRGGGDTATGIDLLRTGGADLYATITAGALDIVAGLPGARVIPGVFETVTFAVAIPQGGSDPAQSKLMQIVNDAKATGMVQETIEKSGLKGARVAPN
jgi:polar amino acid transport system substrate-binding protein